MQYENFSQYFSPTTVQFIYLVLVIDSNPAEHIKPKTNFDKSYSIFD